MEAGRQSCTSVYYKQLFIVTVIISLFFGRCFALINSTAVKDTCITSTAYQAIEFINQLPVLTKSTHWPNIRPETFIINIRSVVNNPISIYPGNGTNFCGYGALTYLFLKDDPLGFTKLMLQLYRDGKTTFRGTVFIPSTAIKKEAGLLKYKGILDIHPAEQMWFLTLAGHYKGYLNIFNRKYNPGDEDKFWASVNYAKFNRMVKNLLPYDVHSRGSDLIRPDVGDLYSYVQKQLRTGAVVLFINNRIVHKKNNVTIKLAVPTHFIVVEKLQLLNNLITMVYWDYGSKSQIQMTPSFFKRITYGITGFTKKISNAN